MTQPDLFSAPPIRGKRPRSRHASYSGRQAVEPEWAERQRVVLDRLKQGPKSRQQLEALTPYPINSICSVIGALLKAGAIERTEDYDVHVDHKGRTTKRETFQIRRQR